MRTKGTIKTGGRTKGSVNKITADLKVKMTNFLTGNMDQFINDFNNIIDPIQRAKLYIEAYKIVMPKAEEEVEEEKKINEEFMRRLFPGRYTDSE